MPRGRGWRWIRRLAVFLLAAALLGAGALGGLWWWVVQHPGPHLERAAILAAISQESPVYYRDGVEKIGVFFQEEHRQYLSYPQLPPDFVKALVAAEDRDFFQHHGFSTRGIARAMVQNVLAGRTVAGGSTLTQQTAKNLFKRKDRSIREKLRELGNALALEHLYEKEEILEFYSNQFYVNGNGRGLGIAARWFFDKDVGQLTLQECAFLAGVVKGPERYNPWVVGAERRARAEEAARIRTGYVLDRMLALGSLDRPTWTELKGAPLPVRRGRFRFERSVVLDEVERELARPEIQRALAAAGVDDPGSAGLRIVTTVDREIQEGAVYGLRHHLSEIGTVLDAPPTEALFLVDGATRPMDGPVDRAHSFHSATLIAIDPAAGEATVDLGGRPARLDKEANRRIATARLRAAGKNTWVEVKGKDVSAFLESLRGSIGRAAVVSVRRIGEDGVPIVDWESATALQGAVVVLDRGEVRAMVGGTSNAEFNRAVAAKRQFGSTWKPVVYQAALQLGWTATDPLRNVREVYPYQSTWYYPRPDHKDAPPEVSMGWAAAKSENLASIWLLYHLCDKLSPEQFRVVAEGVGLTQGPLESREDWIHRLEKEGIQPTPGKRRAALYEQARAELGPDLDFAGREEERRRLERLPYGDGVDAELTRVRKDRALDKAERSARTALLTENFVALQAEAEAFLTRRREILAGLAQGAAPAFDRLWVLPTPEGTRTVWTAEAPEGARAMGPEDLADVGPVDAAAGSVPGALADGRVDIQGTTTLETVLRLGSRVSELDDGGEAVDLWLWEELARLREFRVRVSLAYIARLAGTAGVRTQLVPVLSLPLGASEVSLLEMALLYQGMWLSGRSRFFADPLVLAGGPIPPALQVGPPPETPAFSIISEIYLADGRLIYRTARQIEPTQPGELGAELASMLRAVVLHGTGTRAEGAVRPGNEASEQRWLPIFGKTGTTNSYRNAAFVGFVPTADPTDGALRPGVGMTVATYVGYDDNREMRRGGARLMGASAALPIWIATAQAIGTGVRLPPAAIDEQPGAVGLIWPDNVGAVTVRATDGLPAVGGETEGLAELRVPARGPSFAPVAMLLPAPAEPDVEDGGAQPEATPDPGPDDPSGEGETPSGEGAIEPGTAPSAAPGDPAGPHGGTR